MTTPRKKIKTTKFNIMVAGTLQDKALSIHFYKRKRKLRNFRDKLVQDLQIQQIMEVI